MHAKLQPILDKVLQHGKISASQRSLHLFAASKFFERDRLVLHLFVIGSNFESRNSTCSQKSSKNRNVFPKKTRQKSKHSTDNLQVYTKPSSLKNLGGEPLKIVFFYTQLTRSYVLFVTNHIFNQNDINFQLYFAKTLTLNFVIVFFFIFDIKVKTKYHEKFVRCKNSCYNFIFVKQNSDIQNTL